MGREAHIKYTMATATQDQREKLDTKLSNLVQEKGLSIDAWNKMRDKRELVLMQHSISNTDDTRHSEMVRKA